MTIKDYISQKFNAFGTISEAELLDMSLIGNFNIESEFTPEVEMAVGKASIRLIEERLCKPMMKSVSESGFSASWDNANVGKYYMYLCRRYGVTPDKTTIGQLGINVIIDKTDIW